MIEVFKVPRLNGKTAKALMTQKRFLLSLFVYQIQKKYIIYYVIMKQKIFAQPIFVLFLMIKIDVEFFIFLFFIE